MWVFFARKCVPKWVGARFVRGTLYENNVKTLIISLLPFLSPSWFGHHSVDQWDERVNSEAGTEPKEAPSKVTRKKEARCPCCVVDGDFHPMRLSSPTSSTPPNTATR
jgi:hypothetical protein